MSAMAAPTDRELLKRTLAYSISSEIRSQDTLSLIILVARNMHAQDLAWSFTVEHWDLLYSRYREGSTLGRLLSATIGGMTTREQLDTAHAFLKGHDMEALQESVEGAIEQAEANIRWIKWHSGSVLSWLTEHDF